MKITTMNGDENVDISAGSVDEVGTEFGGHQCYASTWLLHPFY